MIEYVASGAVGIVVFLVVMWYLGKVTVVKVVHPCPNCETTITDDHQFCPHCGTEQ